MKCGLALPVSVGTIEITMGLGPVPCELGEEDWLCNLQGPVQNEHVGPLFLAHFSVGLFVIFKVYFRMSL